MGIDFGNILYNLHYKKYEPSTFNYYKMALVLCIVDAAATHGIVVASIYFVLWFS